MHIKDLGKIKGVRVATGVSVLVLLYVWCKAGLASAELASWVQAIGSIAAIGIGVWTFAEQRRAAEERDTKAERDSVTAMLQGISAEVESSWDQFYTVMRPYLFEPAPAGAPVDIWHHIDDNPFPVYGGSVSKIGTVQDLTLRKQIISTYALARGLASMLQINNRFTEEYQRHAALARATFPGDVKMLIVKEFVRAGVSVDPDLGTTAYVAHSNAANQADAVRRNHGAIVRELAGNLAKEVAVLKVALKTALESVARGDPT